MAITNYSFNLYKEPNYGENIIKQSFSLVADMEHEITKYERLLQLAKKDRVSIIKDNVDYTNYAFCLKDAKKWYYMINDKSLKIDKRKHYQEKDMYEYFIKYFKEDFISDRDFKITGFLSGGFEEYYIRVEFECNEKCFAIEIPIIKNINEKNIEYANYARLTLLVKENDSYWNSIASSYKEEDIKEAFEKEIGDKNE